MGGDGFQGVATFSVASGAISSPSIPGSLPVTSRLSSIFSHSLAGPCKIRDSTVVYVYGQEDPDLRLIQLCFSVIKWRVYTDLPGEVLGHAVEDHLSQRSSAKCCKGSNDMHSHRFHISRIHSFTLKTYPIDRTSQLTSICYVTRTNRNTNFQIWEGNFCSYSQSIVNHNL